jgi:membrane protease YdiL (CAAX protease family)
MNRAPDQRPSSPGGPVADDGLGRPTVRQAVVAVLVVTAAYSAGMASVVEPRHLRLFSEPELALVSSLMVAVAGGAMAWFYACLRPGASLRRGWALFWPGRRWVMAGVAFGLLAGTAAAGFRLLMLDGGRLARVHDALGYGLMLAYLLVGPLGEEAFYRALILPALTRRFGFNAGLAVLTVSNATLAALGVPNPVAVFAIAFVPELGLGLLRHFSRSLWPSLAANLTLTTVYYALLFL